MIKQMPVLRSTIHPDVTTPKNTDQRIATRGIITHGEEILLIFTARYHDYSLPGGGLHDDEDIITGLIREVEEETGAENIHNVVPYGSYEELRPWYKDGFDSIQMLSYCFTCNANKQLGTPRLEENEIKNGVSALWINIHEAIAHNLEVIANHPRAGLSIERETYLLQQIVKDIVIK